MINVFIMRIYNLFTAQYKNKKNFINLTHHKADFGYDVEWHHFETAHGKGSYDGIGGTIKECNFHIFFR